MRRCPWAIALLLAFPALGRAADGSLPDAKALQETFQEAIRRAEPSIACVLVSRSDLYRRWFRKPPANDGSGRLGEFRGNVQASIPPQDQQERNEYAKLLEKKQTGRNPFGVQRGRYVEQQLWRLFDLSDPENVPESYGSGIVISDQGLVLTNYHVVRDAAKVYVRLPGGHGGYADIHAADPRSDLAVLKLLDSHVRPPALKLGDGGRLRKGQFILSLANPFAAGFRDGSPSASWGIISNLRRRSQAPALSEQDRNRVQLQHMAALIQTDARLNLGCSGGALVNLQGELVGITSALAAITGSETAGGFALPIDAEVRQIIAVLERGEEVSYGFLGVSYPNDRDYRRGDELRLGPIVAGSPAERAGLQMNDVILAVNGRPVAEPDDLFLAIGICLAGSEARLDLRRPDGTRRTLNVTLDKYYVPDKGIASSRPPFVHGMRVDYASVLMQRDKARAYQPGVYVSEVQTDGPAEHARLHEVVITQVNGQSVRTPGEFYRIAGKLPRPLTLTVLEQGHPKTVKLD